MILIQPARLGTALVRVMEQRYADGTELMQAALGAAAKIARHPTPRPRPGKQSSMTARRALRHVLTMPDEV